MARYYYLVSGLDHALWTNEDGNFGTGHAGSEPTDYIVDTTVKEARFTRDESLIQHNYPCTIYKFSAKAPYKYLGVVA